MRIFLINLARRPDRLAAMTAQAQRLNLSVTRVEAVDARLGPGIIPKGLFDDRGPLGEIPLGDKCCTLSHVRAWREFLATDDSHACVLEDDVHLTQSATTLLKDDGWIPAGAALVKLEHYGPSGQSILVSDCQTVAPGFRLARLNSRHTGAAAYIVSRGAAQRLAAVSRFSLPVDHLLFNPNNSPLFACLQPWQLMPALARQQDFIGAKSDIEGWRVGLRKRDWTYVKRETIRFGYDLKLLPAQIGLWLAGRARLVRIGTEE